MALTLVQIAQLRDRLLAERTRLRGGSVLASVREVDSNVGDEMDGAESSLEQAGAIERSEQGRTRLVDVEEALAKIEAGTYGTSELSGDPIDYGRLAAVPWARFTAREQEELERAARR
ncbi:MAG TPA: TraR/DksA C4-type zinc finger protein [Polyangiaceae bacterium]|nr:TraR/DksA C4-type zinc finger protein [Polyangiaceae bacterium]